jgi:hypothetical protein
MLLAAWLNWFSAVCIPCIEEIIPMVITSFFQT